MHEVFGRNTEIKKMAKTPIPVHFISIDFPTLRGFSGINELFINESYFSAKISEWKSNTRLLNSITKMDLITIALHECAHVRIRQVIIWLNFFLLYNIDNCGSLKLDVKCFFFYLASRRYEYEYTQHFAILPHRQTEM